MADYNEAFASPPTTGGDVTQGDREAARELAETMAGSACIYGSEEDGPDWCGDCHGCRESKASGVIARLLAALATAQPETPVEGVGLGRKVERPFAYCCAEGGGRVEHCDCVNKNHGTAWFDAPTTDPVSREAAASEELRIKVEEADRSDWPQKSPEEISDIIRDAYLAGAMAVHTHWGDNPGEAPRGDPEFGEAAYDYMMSVGPMVLTVADAPVASQGVGAVECHGLDTPERVCFYEQDFYVLSNFSSFSVEWDGLPFATSEHLYHWLKFATSADGWSCSPMIYSSAVMEARSAHDAFKIAQKYKEHRRPDWDAVKVDFMREILRAKAEQHEYVHRKLLATGDRELVENSWRDDYWGWGPNRDGQNMLGKLWMEVRAELRAALSPPSSPVDGEKGNDVERQDAQIAMGMIVEAVSLGDAQSIAAAFLDGEKGK